MTWRVKGLDYSYYPWEESSQGGRLAQILAGTSGDSDLWQDLRYAYPDKIARGERRRGGERPADRRLESLRPAAPGVCLR
jgi:hypothetical protein